MISVLSTVPPHFSTTMPLFQSVPPHFTVTIPLFHHILLSLWLCYCFTVPPYLTVTWHCHTFPLLYHTLLSPWLRAIVPPLCTITVTLVPLFHRTLLSLWHCSITLYYYCETGSATVPLLYHSLLSLWHYATQFHHTFLSLYHCSTTFYYHCDSVPLDKALWLAEAQSWAAHC